MSVLLIYTALLNTSLNRPPIITHNKFKTFEMEIDDNDSSDSDYPNPSNN